MMSSGIYAASFGSSEFGIDRLKWEI